MSERISYTYGGRLANTIRASIDGDKADGGGNSLSAGKQGDFDPKAEVAAFRDRDKKDGDDSEPPKK